MSDRPEEGSAVCRCLFVYGTLMDDTLVAELTGQSFSKEAAVLTGYRRISHPSGYPSIVSDPSGSVDGVMLRDVDAEALRIFDRYEDEGRLYRRTEVIARVAGRDVRALTYVGIPAVLTRSL